VSTCFPCSLHIECAPVVSEGSRAGGHPGESKCRRESAHHSGAEMHPKREPFLRPEWVQFRLPNRSPGGRLRVRTRSSVCSNNAAYTACRLHVRSCTALCATENPHGAGRIICMRGRITLGTQSTRCWRNICMRGRINSCTRSRNIKNNILYGTP
jgi:hypothetical protein